MSSGSCFLDAYVALIGSQGYNTANCREFIREAVYDLAPDFDHDTQGYHPFLMNAALCNLGFPMLAPVDVCPADGTGAAICVVGLLKEDSVVVGINKDGNEHAVAYNPGGFGYSDPATGSTSVECPLWGLRTQWVVSW